MVSLVVVGILFIVFGFIIILRGYSKNNYIRKIQNSKNYEKTIGTVVCDAYHMHDSTEQMRAVTPIVEYQVNGETYETCNSQFNTYGELPVDTKVYLWYNKNNPTEAVLGTELKSNLFYNIFGIYFILSGICFIILNI